ncbi:MAG: bifunctional UDP-N-acetylglucosamine diphosphorylase/glucosamine-1-phosphate N-acetyltransferase GlmU [Thermoleophilia bacterium]|nr:bifunctional UDP-N-acetylglucosamine diphosphorylase/glucosamine-1-phosphate N-acetyltransferase GlmU [Thermoleophilia bacterium]
MKLGVVVLAAGKGTRMRSSRAKVLHACAGRPMLTWVLDAVGAASPAHTVVVVGHGAEDVAASLPDGVTTAVQAEQRGTGHATQVGLAALAPDCDHVVVACGDTPLVRPQLFRALVESHAGSGHAATMVTAVLDDAGSYGRVVRSGDGAVEAVVEAADADDAQLALGEINAGIFCFSRPDLEDALTGLRAHNAQGELYLPDVLGAWPGRVGALVSDDPDVVAGVNTRVQLAEVEEVLQRRLREELMLSGVTMTDPSRVYLEHGVEVGEDTVLYPGVHLTRATKIGARCQIGPDVVIEGSTVGDDVAITAARVHYSDVADGVTVGPFAYLRPGTDLREGAKVGTYVETKNSTVGAGSKVPHLSYIGDATIGEGTNVGAGNITANYDGFRKHRTTIGSRVRTGSDCVMVAPVTIGDDAMTAAGSILTHDVPAGALGIARARQSNIEGFTEKAAAKAAAAKAKADGEASS